MRPAKSWLSSILLSAGAVGAAAAQAPVPPPADTIVVPAKPSDWALALDFGFNVASGNSNFAVLNSAAKVTRRPSADAEFEWQAGIEYGKKDGVLAEKRISSALKFDYLPARTVSPFTFVHAEQDAARKIELQAYGGAGVKYTFLANPRAKLSLSGAVIYNYETFTAARVVRVQGDRSTRWSLRFKGTHRFGPALQLENTTFYQPVLARGRDYDVTAATALTSRAAKHLSLFIRHVYRRDSTPQAEVRSDDQRVTGGLRVEF